MVEKMSSDLTSNRASNALHKRAESIKKWKASDTAKEKPVRLPKQFTIKFEQGTVFLSAVASGEIDETKKLLDSGVDIDYTNVDGLTALHQACIDENEEMVKLLLDRGANIEARDNEGWTPLHAAASAGNVDIAQILIEYGADLAAVNNEGEVPLDLAEEEEMEDFLSDEIDAQDLEVEDARQEEERLMMEDANSWLNQNKVDEVLDWQGATALHVAASKGYNKVISLLLQIGTVDVNVRDDDGWSPIHAAVHWGSKTACELLTEAGANFDLKNNNGQTPCDLAEPEFVKTAENCRKRAKELAKKSNFTKNKRIEVNIDVNDNSIQEAEFRAIENLKKDPPRPAVKGGRAGANGNNGSKSKTNDNSITTNKIESKSGESDKVSSTDKKTVAVGKQVTITTGKPDNVSIKETKTSSVTPTHKFRPFREIDKKQEPKKEDPPPPTRTSVTGRLASVGQEPKKEDPPPPIRTSVTGRLASVGQEPKKEDPSPPVRTSVTGRLGSVGAKYTIGSTANRVEEKKPESKYSSSRFSSSKDEKENEVPSRTSSSYNDSRTTKDNSTADEIDSTTSSTTTATDSTADSRMSIAERLRQKNQQLLTNSDRTSERTSLTDRYTSRVPADSPSVSSVRTGRLTSSNNSTDTGDTKELQRKLDQAVKEVQDYKSKYEKMKQEKEELEVKLEQYKEDIDKMQELKNDNLRLKDENGALIRVISKLSRTPASS